MQWLLALLSILRAVDQQPRSPNRIVVVDYQLVVFQSRASVSDDLRMRDESQGSVNERDTESKTLTESNPVGGAVRLLCAAVRIWPLPTTTRFRNIALLDEPELLVYPSDLEDVALVYIPWLQFYGASSALIRVSPYQPDY